MEEEARGGDGHGQEEAGLGDRAAQRGLGERGGGRRLQQAPGPQLGRRENHAAAEEAQVRRRRRPPAARVRGRGLVLSAAARPPRLRPGGHGPRAPAGPPRPACGGPLLFSEMYISIFLT